MKNPEEKQNSGTEKVLKTIIQGDVPYREHGLKLHLEEASVYLGESTLRLMSRKTVGL